MPHEQLLHPEAAMLKAFALGNVADDDVDAIQSHLRDCPSCCQLLDNVGDDTFVGLLRETETVADRNAGQRDVETAAPTEDARNRIAAVSNPAEAATIPPTVGGDTDAEDDSRTALTRPPAERGTVPALADHPRFRVLEMIGQGGMGAVYRAEHRHMKRQVALKVINPRLVAGESAVDRFRREVEAAARLHHPNIVAAYDAELAGDAHFLVMEYVQGTDLQQVLQQRGPLPVAEACDYIRQAALGLQHAHENGMVHRDIKPHNLMLTPGGEIKILDFGLASLAAEAVAADGLGETNLSDPDAGSVRGASLRSSLTQAGSIMGTPDYMAPEQARDAHAADIRADIYSLGCTLYALLTGKSPFSSGTAIDKIIAHAEHAPPPISRGDVPKGLRDVLFKMLAKSPAERFQTPAEVAEVLQPFAQPLAAPQRTRARWLVSTAIVASALLFLGGVIWVATDKGQLKIDSNVNDVQVVVSKGGQEVEVIDLKTGTTVKRLPSGDYRIAVKGNRSDVKLSKGTVAISRWGKTVVTLTAVPAAPSFAVDRTEFARVVAAGRGKLTPQAKKQLLAENHPMLWQLADPYTRLLIELFAKLPDAVHMDLLKAGYLKWKYSSLDAARQKVYHDVLKLNLDMAKQQGNAVPATMSLEALKKADVGFAVIIIPELKTAVVSWYILFPEHPAPYWVTVVGVHATGKQPYFNAHNKQLSALRLKAYSKVIPAAANPLDEKQLEGTWQLVSVEQDGRPVSAEILKKINFPRQFLFKNNRWGAISPDRRRYESTFTLHPNTNPCGIDVKGSLFEGMPDLHGILKLEGDTLTVCVVDRSRPRPADFTTKGKRGQMLIVARRVAAAKADEQWVSLFNGKDLTGWKTHPRQRTGWKVENGVLIGSGDGISHLFSERGDFTDFHLRAEVKVNETGNSGIFFRCGDGLPRGTFPAGYEAQILNGVQFFDNGKPENQKTGSLYSLQPFLERIVRPDEWFTLEIIARGNHTTIKVNRQVTADYTDRNNTYAKGHVALQKLSRSKPGSQPTVVQFRKIEIKELGAKPPVVALPRTAADVPKFWVGTWRMESRIVVPKMPAEKEPGRGVLHMSLVADGKFLRGVNTSDSGRFQTLNVQTYDKRKGRLLSWLFMSDGKGIGEPGPGIWDAETHTLVFSKRLPDGTQAVHQFELVDANTVKSRLFHQNAKDEIVADIRFTFTRLQAPVAERPVAIDPNRPAEMKVLDRLIGDWHNEMTIKQQGETTAEASRTKARPILMGRMVEAFDATATKNDYWLTWFDPQRKQYRFWSFGSDGTAMEFNRVWNDAAQTMTWSSPDKTFEGRWIFKSKDLRESLMTFKDQAGNTRVQITGISRRIPDLDALQKQTEAWLKLMDDGKYGEAWEQSSSPARKSISKADVIKHYTQMAAKFGKVTSRKFFSRDYVTELPGFPKGRYVLIKFITDFENQKDMVQNVLLIPDNGGWKVQTHVLVPKDPFAKPKKER